MGLAMEKFKNNPGPLTAAADQHQVVLGRGNFCKL